MNNLLNNKFHLELEVLSPLHIGSGDTWMKGSDFLQENNKTVILDHNLILRDLGVDKLSELLISKNEKAFINALGRNKLSEFVEKSFDFSLNTKNDIKCFIKSSFDGKAYVPGSSVKGAIRSVLFHYFREKQSDERIVLGSLNQGNDFMRFIQVSDSSTSNTELVNTKIFNLYKPDEDWIGGWKHGGNNTDGQFRPVGFNTIYEILPIGEKVSFSIGFSEKLFSKIRNHPYYEAKNNLMKGGINQLFELINEHTREYIQKEMAFFEKFRIDETDAIIESYRDILHRIPDDNSTCILKMSAGSGFHSITGDWQYDDYTNTGFYNHGRNQGKKKYKSRKLATYPNKFMPMGFISLRPMLDEEIKEKENVLREKVRFQTERIKAARKKEEKLKEEQRQKEKERQDKLEKELKEKEQKEKERIERIAKAEAAKEAAKAKAKEQEAVNKEAGKVKKEQYLKEGL
ncbi:MAG: type III-A CRISPR-associated RAMP protein Csm5, partial [bacterium]